MSEAPRRQKPETRDRDRDRRPTAYPAPAGSSAVVTMREALKEQNVSTDGLTFFHFGPGPQAVVAKSGSKVRAILAGDLLFLS